MNHENYMQIALKEAELAYQKGEIPVGAIVLSPQNEIIAKNHNLTEQLCDVTAHAELLCVSAVSSHFGTKYLSQCTLYVTLEPCVMCAGALYWAQMGKIVFGASDEKRGFEKIGNLLHPKTIIEKNILADECSKILKDFFKKLRH